ncbi:MAG: hypothetical protein AAB619_01125, partial [Patescibacteria group bacterium]
SNPVPLFLISDSWPRLRLRPGKLGDVAPTLLGLIGSAVPADMTGDNLVVR